MLIFVNFALLGCRSVIFFHGKLVGVNITIASLVCINITAAMLVDVNFAAARLTSVSFGVAIPISVRFVIVNFFSALGVAFVTAS
jgi:hypothetical protein